MWNFFNDRSHLLNEPRSKHLKTEISPTAEHCKFQAFHEINIRLNNTSLNIQKLSPRQREVTN
jgi:hypothetical protein